jgi:hypothetical protein
VQSEVDHAKQKARAMIVDHLFSYCADAKEDLRTSGNQVVPEDMRKGMEDMFEGMRAVTSAIDLLRDELLAWAKEEPR